MPARLLRFTESATSVLFEGEGLYSKLYDIWTISVTLILVCSKYSVYILYKVYLIINNCFIVMFY